MRYQKIETRIWHDEKFIRLSMDAKYLFIYLLTSPHSNAIGIFVLPKNYILADLDWTIEQLREPFSELLRERLIIYDDTSRLICIVNHLKHNTIENLNQAKSAAKILESLPKSSLFSNISELLRKPFHKPLLEQLAKQYAKPEAEAEAEAETETEAERIVKENITVQLDAEPASGNFYSEEPNKGTAKQQKKAKLTDEEWIESLEGNPAYTGIDISKVNGKLLAWCELKGKQPTRARLLNWLNREEKPMQGQNRQREVRNEGLKHDLKMFYSSRKRKVEMLEALDAGDMRREKIENELKIITGNIAKIERLLNGN